MTVGVHLHYICHDSTSAAICTLSLHDALPIFGLVTELPISLRNELDRPVLRRAPEHDHGRGAIDDPLHFLATRKRGFQLFLRFPADRDVAAHAEEGATRVAVGVRRTGRRVPDPAPIRVP